MASWSFSDGNITGLVEYRHMHSSKDVNHRLQMHSSLVKRLSLEKELEGHQGCVNAIAWNAKGSLLVSGSDDTQVNIWDYTNRRLLHNIVSGHAANIFCTKFVPETSDELVVSGAGDAEVRVFNISCARGSTPESAVEPLALFQCHSRRVKKLAVEGGNPHVVWSAGEDGTLRQHDFREGSTCPPAGSSNQECRNILLDLRTGAKKSLADRPRQCLALKSCDISSTRPHQLLIGGSDAFARLYDRRMLPPLSSCQKRMKAPPCVNLFCPVHLSDRGRASLHLTHVAFSPNGGEVLISYSGEHVYLMDVNLDSESNMKYSVENFPKQITLMPVPCGMEIISTIPSTFSHDVPRSCIPSSRYCEVLDAAETSLEESNLFRGIEACNEVLDGRCQEIGVRLKHDVLCNRAALFLKRKWKNDVHMAIRDCIRAQRINPSSFRAHFYMVEALSQLGKHKDALDMAVVAQKLDPSNSTLLERVESIKQQIAAAEQERSKKEAKLKAESEAGRSRSSVEAVHRSEEHSDPSQDGPRSERADSDFDEEMDVDFETSISGDEGRGIESGILHGSLNLRFHRRRDSARERSCSTELAASPSSSENEGVAFQPEVVHDMKQRFVGHCNVGTDIKQASFIGENGEFVASGSDDGRWFIWEKITGRLIKMLAGDDSVVNCVQCHPFDCAIATSGIDNTIKIWTPRAQVPSVVAGGVSGPETADVLSAMEANQQKMCLSRDHVLPFELLERFRMHEFAEGTMHPFECAQT